VKSQVFLFDLGDTLVGYCQGPSFRALLPGCLAGAASALRDLRPDRRLASLDLERALAENVERPDFRVTPFAERLARIFDADLGDLAADETDVVGAAFLAPFFAIADLYPDTLPTLDALLARGARLGVVSNTPWGSPAGPWRAEVARHGVAARCEHVGFCSDVGWRKPAGAPFHAALDRFGVPPEACVFVGDRPSWDVDGALAVGVRAVLIDRDDRYTEFVGPRVRGLAELLEAL
jgi:HAD superfamily hydrolase (TIGR01509 family)